MNNRAGAASHSAVGKGPSEKRQWREFRALTSAGQRQETEQAESDLQRRYTGGERGAYSQSGGYQSTQYPGIGVQTAAVRVGGICNKTDPFFCGFGGTPDADKPQPSSQKRNPSGARSSDCGHAQGPKGSKPPKQGTPQQPHKKTKAVAEVAAFAAGLVEMARPVCLSTVLDCHACTGTRLPRVLGEVSALVEKQFGTSAV